MYFYDLEEDSNIFNPRSIEIRRWAIFMLGLIMLIGIVAPFEIAFSDTKLDGFFVFNRLVDFFFICDIYVNFHLSYSDPKSGLAITSPLKIRNDYMKVWFWIDLVGIIPFDLLFLIGFDKENEDERLGLQIIQLLRLLKLLRLFRAGKIVATFEIEYSINFDMVSLIKFGVVVIFIVHMLACGLFILANMEEAPENWMTYNGVDDTVPTSSRYIMAVYWSTMTVSTIGYGDVGMVTDLERVYASISMILGASVYAFVVGAVGSILENLDQTQTEYNQTLTHLNDYMASISLSQNLRVKLRQYFSQVKRFDSSKASKNEILMYKMSPLLRGLVSSHVNTIWISKVSWLKDCEEEFISEISLVMNYQSYSPKELVIRRDDLCDRLFIIKKGIVMSKGSLYTSNKILGDEMILKCAYRRGYSARALQYVDTSFILKNDLFDILIKYPALEKRVRKEAIRMTFQWTVIAVIEKIHSGTIEDGNEMGKGGWEEGNIKGAIKESDNGGGGSKMNNRRSNGRNKKPSSSFLKGRSPTGGGGGRGGGGGGDNEEMLESIQDMLQDQQSILDSLNRDISFLKASVKNISETQINESKSSFSKLLANTL